jgi:phosphoribosylformimino-5-aminoimidazole carboxamide ribotide isomerase
MIQILPAIDIIGGRCVRLSQGDFSRETSYGVTPVEMASRFMDSGFSSIHVVDLDGARMGKPVNMNSLRAISGITGLQVEWGGGIKTRDDIEAALEAGATSVVCGTVAVRDPALFRSFIDEYGPDRVTLGADVRGTKVAVSGWTKTSEVALDDLIKSFLPGLKNVIVTEISRDGMFTGPDAGFFRDLAREFPEVVFTASGGIGSIEHIKVLEESGIPKVIVGKALYENKIRLEDLAIWSQRG